MRRPWITVSKRMKILLVQILDPFLAPSSTRLVSLGVRSAIQEAVPQGGMLRLTRLRIPLP